jgi:hypothetical protein
MNNEKITVRLKTVFEKVLEEKNITITRELTAGHLEKYPPMV